MSSSSTSQRRARSQLIRDIVLDAAARRANGEAISHEELLAANPQLAQALASELKKLHRINHILEQVDDASCEIALERLEADWILDRSSTRDRKQGSWSSSHLRSSSVASREHDPLTASTAGDSIERLRRASESGTPILTSIGRYQVRGLLGEGGFGRVYLAWDQELKRHVAVKVPHLHRIAHAEDIDAYQQEARLIASLDHPGIVPVYDVGKCDDGLCYVVSKLIPGENLATRIKQHRFELYVSINIVAQVAQALHYAHQRGIVHRDIKPANILLDERNRSYVADFGLALRDETLIDGRSFAGTPAYMSPEQARGESHRVDGRSDIFSLGVVLYQLLTRRKPFKAASHDELLRRIIELDPIRPTQHDESLPIELERICMKAMAKRAADRYQTAEAFAEDLSQFLADDKRIISAGPSPASSSPDEARQVVPKGLRAFDANDADFFLDLLPGPRDRTGLPESIRHWKLQIEEHDSDDTFSVGLIYGPSGCGKSSFVRAGLLPVLSPDVKTIYVEATGDDTEPQLRRKLQKQFPDMPPDHTLPACFAGLRRGVGMQAGEKLLVVIDQFEQWLHGRSDEQRKQLVQALRHCDGEHVQCLLLVRDDFWLALSRFMLDLEVDLLQGQNTCLVDLFDPMHARNVLAAFGRSFGRVASRQSESNNAQDTFLQQSIEVLSDEGKVIPVRLALYAEMVKGRPWVPSTLRELGGAEGVGITFLEETFSARASNLQSRAHEQAARAVLEALLPDAGSEIKGHIRSYPELLDLSGYGHNPRAFKELMRILDSETRMLTHVDAGPEGTEATPGQRCYQLTHDYLVPSLRQWLTKRQKATPVGRAELRLAERATMWNARPERRQLPSILEWFLIRCLTRPSHWSPPQRRMMKAAGRQHALMSAIIASIVIGFLLAGSEVATQAQNLLVSLRVRTASIWMVLGQDDTIWPLLEHDADPTLRTRLIHGLNPIAVSPDEIIPAIDRQHSVSTRRAMLLLAGELSTDATATTNTITRDDASPELIQDIIKIFNDDPDRGMHGAAEWTLLRLGKADDVDRLTRRMTTEKVAGDRQWYLSTQLHTMVIVPGPAEFLMGSPKTDSDAEHDESLHSQQIRRSFSIASRETTVDQFESFIRQNPSHRYNRPQHPQKPPDFPQASVTWYDAAAYCNWLSEQAGLAEDQWCYVPDSEGRYIPGMTVADNIFVRRGYRLPTEAEWEYACRAGAVTPFHFGRDESQLAAYGVSASLNASEPSRVGVRKPNDYGLFDMHGNVSEWCHDRYRIVPTSQMIDAFTLIPGRQPRVIRGGSFRDPAPQLRSAAREQLRPGDRRATLGFRVARSFP